MRWLFPAIVAAIGAAQMPTNAGAEPAPQRDSAGTQSAAERTLEERFRQLDKSGDGKITTDELPESAFFKARDANGDGSITLAEARAFLANSTKSAPAARPPAIRRAPQPLNAADHGVGRLVGDVGFADLAGQAGRLSDFGEKRGVVIAMTSTSCPLSKKYFPTLAELAKKYSSRGVAWLFVNPQAADKPADMRKAAEALGPTAVYIHDQKGALVEAVDAETTADVIVLDAARTIVFHGAIDDQYGFGYSLDAPRHKYLEDALEALLAGKAPPVAATDAPGCALNRAEIPPARAGVTYHNRIARIVQAHCVECHREDGVAPFPLTTFQEVSAHAAMIGQVVEAGAMPPWFAGEQGAAEAHGHASQWANDRSLAASEKSDLLAWVRGGRPEGDPKEAPQARSFHEGWQIGKPDAVFEFPHAVSVKASGVMPYEEVLLDTGLTEDKWVEAIEVQPGDRSVVHHMLIFLSDPAVGGAGDRGTDPGNAFWGIYVPGNSTLSYPAGFAKRLPKGSKLRCQIHYVPSGKATRDKSRIGVVYAPQRPQHEVLVTAIINPHISIPPGASNHREEASLRVPIDIKVLSYLPHMHLRAKACRYRVVDAKGKSRTLLDIPRYDFNWQLLYRYAEPQPLARGDTLKFTVWYDNSDKNPANPDPTQTVRYGQKVSDEMHLGYVEYFVPGAVPGQRIDLSGAK